MLREDAKQDSDHQDGGVPETNDSKADDGALLKADGRLTEYPNANHPLCKGPARKVLTFIILICWAVLVYIFTFHLVTNIYDQSTHIIHVIQSTADQTYTNLAEAYQGFKSTPEEIADLMTEFYVLLAEMGYYDTSVINRPPHVDPGINKNLAAEVKYSEAAIELMELLPYLNMTREWGQDDPLKWSKGAFNDEFLMSGVFVDMRKDEHLSDRDPFHQLEYTGGKIKSFDEEGGQYMRPDYLCLSFVPQDGVVMVLNARNRTQGLYFY
jgi:hypothetical protein